MSKPILGIDIGTDKLKLAYLKNGQIKKLVTETVPENVVKSGQVVSVETMSELIRNTCKKNGIKAVRAAVVLSGENVYTRNVTMPIMNNDQLMYNLPFEFRDYLEDDLKNYVFDYAMISTVEELKSRQLAAEAKAKDDTAVAPDEYGDDDENSNSMDLYAVVAPKELIADMDLMTRKAGLKMVSAAPPVSAFANIIRYYENRNKSEDGAPREYCILDLGYRNIRMYMYKGDILNVSKVLERGMFNVDEAVADLMGVDVHLAHTYVMTDHENCLKSDKCANIFNDMAVEMMRALNFYRFSNPSSNLEDVWMCGGGASIEELRTAISEMLDMKLHPAVELLEDLDVTKDDNNMLLSIGIALN